MPFQLSPGVISTETDLTNIVAAVSTSVGAAVGEFAWGPVLDPITIGSEPELVARFSRPNDQNFLSFFSSANFLAYANNLLVVRADSTALANATALSTGQVSALNLTAGGSGYASIPTVTLSAPDADGGIQATATAVVAGSGISTINVVNPGTGFTSAPTVVITPAAGDTGSGATATATLSGNAIATISVTAAGSGYRSPPVVTVTGGGGGTGATFVATLVGGAVQSLTIVLPGSGYATAPTVTITSSSGTGATATSTLSVVTGAVKVRNTDDYLANYASGQGVVGEFIAKYPGKLGNSIKVVMADSATFTAWAYASNFAVAPGTSGYAANLGGSNDELYALVIDATGAWTGTIGTILEKYDTLSKASDGKNYDGTTSYYKDVINSQSKYVWWADHPVSNATGSVWGVPAAGTAFKSLVTPVSRQLSGGVDDYNAGVAGYEAAWDLFNDDTRYQISLVVIGAATAELATYVLQNVAATRKDCIAFASVQDVTTGQPIIGSNSATSTAAIAYRAALPSTSYGALDSGFKYQFDKYNNKYRWVPLCGDSAGLCARTDQTNDPWWSPAGYNRGQIKNAVKLAFNPNKTARDLIYPNQINPVVSFPQEGVILYGDRTLQTKASAFDRIGVRRLFITLEKAIATAAKYDLFEFNDAFTQAQFVNMVNPYMRNVQGRRGILSFSVVCDSSNNTPDIVAADQFVGTITVQPNHSINFITLNFVAQDGVVTFTETTH